MCHYIFLLWQKKKKRGNIAVMLHCWEVNTFEKKNIILAAILISSLFVPLCGVRLLSALWSIVSVSNCSGKNWHRYVTSKYLPRVKFHLNFLWSASHHENTPRHWRSFPGFMSVEYSFQKKLTNYKLEFFLHIRKLPNFSGNGVCHLLLCPQSFCAQIVFWIHESFDLRKITRNHLWSRAWCSWNVMCIKAS